MLADCDRCALRDIACAECVITVLPDGQAGLGDEERRALHVLAAAGLVPPLRFRPARSAAAQTARANAAQAVRPGPRRPAARRPTGRASRQPATSHR